MKTLPSEVPFLPPSWPPASWRGTVYSPCWRFLPSAGFSLPALSDRWRSCPHRHPWLAKNKNDIIRWLDYVKYKYTELHDKIHVLKLQNCKYWQNEFKVFLKEYNEAGPFVSIYCILCFTVHQSLLHGHVQLFSFI